MWFWERLLSLLLSIKSCLWTDFHSFIVQTIWYAFRQEKKSQRNNKHIWLRRMRLQSDCWLEVSYPGIPKKKRRRAEQVWPVSRWKLEISNVSSISMSHNNRAAGHMTSLSNDFSKTNETFLNNEICTFVLSQVRVRPFRKRVFLLVVHSGSWSPVQLLDADIPSGVLYTQRRSLDHVPSARLCLLSGVSAGHRRAASHWLLLRWLHRNRLHPAG